MSEYHSTMVYSMMLAIFYKVMENKNLQVFCEWENQSNWWTQYEYFPLINKQNWLVSKTRGLMYGPGH